MNRWSAREERIRELEGLLSRRGRIGLRAPVALAAIALAALLFVNLRAGVLYAFSPSAPIDLGAEGGYHFERLAPNRYAQVHGVPTFRGVYVQMGGRTQMVEGLQGTPVLVMRPLVSGEELPARGRPPPPNQQPLGVRGRLLREADAARYRELFSAFSAKDRVVPWTGERWLLIQGDRPGRDLTDVGLAGLLAAFAGLNAWVLLRSLRRRSG